MHLVPLEIHEQALGGDQHRRSRIQLVEPAQVECLPLFLRTLRPQSVAPLVAGRHGVGGQVERDGPGWKARRLRNPVDQPKQRCPACVLEGRLAGFVCLDHKPYRGEDRARVERSAVGGTEVAAVSR
jgi:hypothetical protein